jgi:hypothetical protein
MAALGVRVSHTSGSPGQQANDKRAAKPGNTNEARGRGAANQASRTDGCGEPADGRLTDRQGIRGEHRNENDKGARTKVRAKARMATPPGAATLASSVRPSDTSRATRTAPLAAERGLSRTARPCNERAASATVAEAGVRLRLVLAKGWVRRLRALR